MRQNFRRYSDARLEVHRKLPGIAAQTQPNDPVTQAEKKDALACILGFEKKFRRRAFANRVISSRIPPPVANPYWTKVQ